MNEITALRGSILKSQMYADMPQGDQVRLVKLLDGLADCDERFPRYGHKSQIRVQIEAMAPIISAAQPLRKYSSIDQLIGRISGACRESIDELEQHEQRKPVSFMDAYRMSSAKSAFKR
jgi:hypothetical protein